MSQLTCERLRELLDYNPWTGVFTRRVRAGRCPAGSIAGSVNAAGYVLIGVDGTTYYAHRLAWLHVKGAWPAGLIDHRIGKSNSWSNLRDATRTINGQNMRSATAASSTGLLGAFPVGKRFKSSIRVGGKLKHIGYYETALEAHEAYVDFKRLHHAGCTI